MLFSHRGHKEKHKWVNLTYVPTIHFMGVKGKRSRKAGEVHPLVYKQIEELPAHGYAVIN